jgi:hypothetical protein
VSIPKKKVASGASSCWQESKSSSPGRIPHEATMKHQKFSQYYASFRMESAALYVQVLGRMHASRRMKLIVSDHLGPFFQENRRIVATFF